MRMVHTGKTQENEISGKQKKNTSPKYYIENFFALKTQPSPFSNKIIILTRSIFSVPSYKKYYNS